jgi:hypothetical protein
LTIAPLHIHSEIGEKTCEVTEQPLSEARGNDKSEFGATVADVVAKMRTPVTVLNVTLMGSFRSDAHVGNWSYPPTVLDCSHWCLPGVPDAWNELVFSYLLTNGEFLFMWLCIYIYLNTVKIMYVNQTILSYNITKWIKLQYDVYILTLHS